MSVHVSPALFVILLATAAFAAETPRALPPGTLPDDARMGPLKELDGYFPFTPPADRAQWETRAAELRVQMRVALGLWPEPTRTPLNAVIHGRIDQPDYTVEKVFFESMPGFFVTGNLYRPKGKAGLHPAVLCPHGHWNDARFHLRTDAEMKRELDSGAELLPESGRSMFQSIGVQLARMGIVAFVYDMIGYCDSQQIGYEVAHKFAKQRPEMNARENWGLYSPQAEAHAQSVMGLQTWNSMRAVDFLASLSDVDVTRIGCTGASGGGTQTMLLAALDGRISVQCPAVMVSTAMQGGCTCENASLLRVATGNVEFAALFAPKPLGMTTANDWTKEMPVKGFPELQRLYALLGAPKNVELWAHAEFPHNYNAVARAHIYRWFNQHFALGLKDAQLKERDYPLLQKEQLSVWDAAHPAPAGGPDFERKLLRWWHDDAQAQITRDFRRIADPAWLALIGRPSTDVKEEHFQNSDVYGGDRIYPARTAIYRAADGSFATPQITIDPIESRGHFVIWVMEQGKSGIFRAPGELTEDAQRVLRSGAHLVLLDLIGQGEFLTEPGVITQTPVSKNPREAACFTFGYNRSFFAQRAQDIAGTIARLRRDPRVKRISLLAMDGTGAVAAGALAVQAGCDAAVIRDSGFRLAGVTDLRDPGFTPAGAKYGDLPGAVKLAELRGTRVLRLTARAPDVDPLDWIVSAAR